MKLLLLCLLLITTTGCFTPNLAKSLEKLGDDPSTLTIDVNSIYGRAKLIRTNPGEKSKVTIAPDGTVTIVRE